MTGAGRSGSRVVLASRRSPLAMAQTQLVARELGRLGFAPEIRTFTTTGDRLAGSLADAPGKGVFVKELEEALLSGEAQLAVHSAKDVPGDLPEGLAILAVPGRADPHDVLIGPASGLDGLPAGARVATGSPRRRLQLAQLRPDLRWVDIRGNVGTRLGAIAAGRADAVVLAAAGLHRLGLSPPGAVPLDLMLCTPAPGQGFLALEGRPQDPVACAAAAAIDDAAAHACLLAERQVLQGLGGGCAEPIGAFCDARRLIAFRCAADGSGARRVVVEGAPSPALGLRAVRELVA